MDLHACDKYLYEKSCFGIEKYIAYHFDRISYKPYLYFPILRYK